MKGIFNPLFFLKQSVPLDSFLASLDKGCIARWQESQVWKRLENVRCCCVECVVFFFLKDAIFSAVDGLIPSQPKLMDHTLYQERDRC